MKLGLDISQIVHGGTGVARYNQGLVDAILSYDQDNQWTFLFSSLRQKIDPELKERIQEKNHILKEYKLPPTFVSLLWNRIHRLSIEWVTGDLDWFITSDWTEPPAKKTKKATVIHDLVFLRYPETVDWKIIKTQQQRLIHVCTESDLVFTDSYASKKDILKYLEIDEKKVQVVYPGITIKKVEPKTVKQVLAKYGLTKPFILTVGKQEPRKNITGLIKAFSSLKSTNIELVVVGPKGWDSQTNTSIEQDIKTTKKSIHRLDLVTEEELVSLYQSCLFFVYPSFWEGFGYPILEAMNLGVAVATSETSSMKEIGTGAAIFFRPKDIEDIKDKLNLMIKDQNLRKDLMIKGQARAKNFTWEKAYEQIIESLRKNRN